MGSGLQVVQEVHVKNRCAWLNHSSEPAAFLHLVQCHPNIRLWFSGVRLASHCLAFCLAALVGSSQGLLKVATLTSPPPVNNFCSS